MSLSPCGESGLKFCLRIIIIIIKLSLPMRGEWIEMIPADKSWSASRVSPHAGRVD